MEIIRVDENKKAFLDLLLLADEQESMIDRYLERGVLFVLRDPDTRDTVGVCIVTDEGGGVFELKNLATAPEYQRRGYGRAMIDHAMGYFAGEMKEMLVGTGDSPNSIPFYEKCGFSYSHRVKNFFTDNYDHPIIDDGVQLVDMVYLKRTK